MIEKLLRIWCRLAHEGLFRPVNGTVRCKECLRTYDIGFGAYRHMPQ